MEYKSRRLVARSPRPNGLVVSAKLSDAEFVAFLKDRVGSSYTTYSLSIETANTLEPIRELETHVSASGIVKVPTWWSNRQKIC